MTNGFVMMQESIYVKLLTNYAMCELEVAKLRKNKPKEGIVQVLTITEKQFASIEYITGEASNDHIDTMDRVVVL